MFRRRLGFLFIIFAIIIGAVLSIMVAVRQSHTEAEAAVQVDSGDASIVHALDGVSETVSAGNSASLKVGDSLQAHGNVTLLFSDASLEMPAGTELKLTDYGFYATGTQIKVMLKAGQVVGKVSGSANSASSGSSLTVTTPTGALTTHAGAIMVSINQAAQSQYGVMSGAAELSAGGQPFTLSTNQGTVSSADSQPAAPILWASVNLTTYRPDSSTVILPASLVNIKTHESYTFNSNQPFLVPPGTYDLAVKVLNWYKSSGIILKAGVTNDLPITLAESIFTVVDDAGAPIKVTGLNLHGDESTHIVPGKPILISPGQSTLTAARDEEPNAIQPVDLNLEPGERAQIPLHISFFGGGRVKVNVVPPNGTSVPPVTANVYLPNRENGVPLQTFKTDAVSPFLAPGDYIVVVPTQIAVRSLVTIAKNQDVTITVPLATLVVNYTDTLGRPTAPFIYIAASPEMKRLDYTIVQMTQTPYGLSSHAGTPLLLPAGNYTIRVDDKKDVDVPDVKLEPSALLVLPVEALP